MAFAFYATGTASVSAGSTTVTGTGTLWATPVMAGDTFESGGLAVRIAAVVDDDTLTLAYGWPGSTLSGSAYLIVYNSPARNDGTYVAERARELIERQRILDDGIATYAAKGAGTNTPPGTPAASDLYLVGSSPTGAWVGYAGYLAVATDAGAWRFTAPAQGMRVYDTATDLTWERHSAAWVSITPVLTDALGVADGVATLDSGGKVPSAQLPAFTALGKLEGIVTDTTTARTLGLTDLGKAVEMDNASPNTLTVPPNASVAFPLYTTLPIIEKGAGRTIIAAGAGVTIRSRSSRLQLAGQYAQAWLFKRATDEWVLSGDLVASSIAFQAGGAIGTDLSSYTFSAASIGAVPGSGETREVFVSITWHQGGVSTRTLSSATIGGVSATLETAFANSNLQAMCVARAVVPAGTTADVVLTFSGTVQSCTIGVYRLMNRPAPGSSATDSGSATFSSVTTRAISGIDVNAGGFVLSAVSWDNTVSAPALSGITGAASDAFHTPETTGYAAHGSTPLQAAGSTGNTLTWSWTTSRSGIAAAWAF